MDNYKTDNIYFPLCCLNYNKDVSKTADILISYGIIEYGLKLINEFDLSDCDNEAIENFIEVNNIRNVNKSKYEDLFFILSAKKLGIIIYDLSIIKKQHSKLQKYVNNFENKYGTDAKVKVHRGLLFEVKDNKFNERLFRVYCGIVSVIGSKKFVRITNKRISYRMLGFKTEDVYYKEKSKCKLLTARQIKTCSEKLSEKNLISKLTYRNRLTFYSTAYRDKKFNKILTSSIAFNKEKKEVNKILNQLLTSGVEEKRKQIREKLLTGLTIKEIKCEMEFIKAV